MDEAGLHYGYVDVQINREARTATITVRAPESVSEDTVEKVLDAGANWWPLQMARELDDAILDLTDELAIAFEEVVLVQDPDGQPTHRCKSCVTDRARIVGHEKEREDERLAPRILVLSAPEHRSHRHVDGELLAELTLQCLLRALTRLHLAAGELPFARVMSPWRALAGEHAAAPNKHAGHNFDTAVVHEIAPVSDQL
jgi:hypothetical protein